MKDVSVAKQVKKPVSKNSKEVKELKEFSINVQINIVEKRKTIKK